MKKFLFALLSAGLLSACSPGEEPTPSDDEAFCTAQFELGLETFPQTWKLVKMTGSMVNSATTDVDPAWQETIFLRANGTFTKTRIRDDKTIKASGAYTIEWLLSPEPTYIALSLTYPVESELIGSCTSQSLLETYIIKSKCTLVGTWNACDGRLGLEYARQAAAVD